MTKYAKFFLGFLLLPALAGLAAALPAPQAWISLCRLSSMENNEALSAARTFPAPLI